MLQALSQVLSAVPTVGRKSLEKFGKTWPPHDVDGDMVEDD